MSDSEKPQEDYQPSSQQSFVDRLSSGDFWLRLIYMVLFFIIASVATYLMTFVVIAQFFWHLFAGEKNEKILTFSKQLAVFIHEILLFLTQHSEEKPFPFKDWPE